jgi:ribosome assembly protein YihI (activator of Der GTPase)
MIASLVICNIKKKKKKKTSPGPRASKRKKKNCINLANRFGSESRIEVYLVESNRIESKTQVEKSYRNPI